MAFDREPSPVLAPSTIQREVRGRSTWLPVLASSTIRLKFEDARLGGAGGNGWNIRMFEVVHTVGRMLSRVESWVWAKLAPVADGVAAGIAVDAVRPRRELLRENALLRLQLVVLRRKVPRPRLMPLDRLRLLLCAAMVAGWQRVVLIVRPETVLRWHREGLRRIWKRKSQSAGADRRLSAETVVLIRAMATANRTGERSGFGESC
jgi:hypothetical protein